MSVCVSVCVSVGTAVAACCDGDKRRLLMFTARAACPACLNNCPASPVLLCVSLSLSFSLCLSACECLRRAIVEAYGQTIMDNCNGDNNVSLMFHT